jgi:hypothetical protein
MGAKMRARHAREAAQKAAREADRAEAYGMVGSNGGLWRARAAIADHWAMPQRRPGLVRSRMQSLQDPREPTARCHSSATGYTDLEARGRAEMWLTQEREAKPSSLNPVSARLSELDGGDRPLTIVSSDRDSQTV